MNTCLTCKYWSSLLARAVDGGEVEAFCLCPDQPFQYHPAGHSCDDYTFGASVDDPNIHDYEEADYV